MCTAFVKKGSDLIAGFNFDADESLWDYKIYTRPNMFYIGIKVGSTVYKVHGVNSNGNFANLPYANAPEVGGYSRAANCKRLDLLVGDYISGKLSLDEVRQLLSNKTLVNLPNASMHTLFADAKGNMLLAQPGVGYKQLEGDSALITNFSVLKPPQDFSFAGYGRDRYIAGNEILAKSSADFSVRDAISLLCEVRQGEPWATRISFVYTQNENSVYYFTGADVSTLKVHRFS